MTGRIESQASVSVDRSISGRIWTPHRGATPVLTNRASAVLARDLHADTLLIATDTAAVYTGWGTPEERAISLAHPDALARIDFAAGSMGPKVEAAIEFVLGTGNDAVIGSLADLPGLLAGTAGSRVSVRADGVTYRGPVAVITGAGISERLAGS